MAFGSIVLYHIAEQEYYQTCKQRHYKVIINFHGQRLHKRGKECNRQRGRSGEEYHGDKQGRGEKGHAALHCLVRIKGDLYLSYPASKEAGRCIANSEYEYGSERDVDIEENQEQYGREQPVASGHIVGGFLETLQMAPHVRL